MNRKVKKLFHGLSSGVFLIGLAVLFHFNAFWPWILALISALAIVEAIGAYLAEKS